MLSIVLIWEEESSTVSLIEYNQVTTSHKNKGSYFINYRVLFDYF